MERRLPGEVRIGSYVRWVKKRRTASHFRNIVRALPGVVERVRVISGPKTPEIDPKIEVHFQPKQKLRKPAEEVMTHVLKPKSWKTYRKGNATHFCINDPDFVQMVRNRLRK